MSISKCILGFLFVICLTYSSHGQYQKLQMSVYYESLCPDSIRFITRQLYPIYNDIKEFIDLHFIPFGKSQSVNGGESFTCQHGELECIGNMIQSCGLNSIEVHAGTTDLAMEYVNCEMSNKDDHTGKICSNEVGLEYPEIHQCFYGGLGILLQLDAEKRTQAIAYPYPSFIPTIVYNEKFDQYLQDSSINNFQTTICKLIKHAASICKPL